MMNTKLSKLFITGCDEKGVWMLDWFLKNYRMHNDIEIHTINFQEGLGWLEKPAAMRRASLLADKVCWLDTDCEVIGDISGIFDYTQPNKLTMAEDKPWSTRRPGNAGKWHNSGVVAFENTPSILVDWELTCATQGGVGDQEVLHSMITNPIQRMAKIEDLPNKYNVLRLQHIDKTVPNDPRIYHWTGPKGKDHIRKMMNE